MNFSKGVYPDISQLSILERRRILARQAHDLKFGIQAREDEARAQGFASVKARQTAEKIQKEKKTKFKTWNQGEGFGADGYHAFKAEQELVRIALRGKAANQINLTKNEDNETILKRIRRKTRVTQTPERKRALGDLPFRIKELNNIWRERNEMRLQDYEARITETALKHFKEVNENSAESKFYFTQYQDDKKTYSSIFKPRIQRLSARAQNINNELDSILSKRVQRAVETREACKSYILQCKELQVTESRQLLACLGSELIRLENFGINHSQMEAIVKGLSKVPITKKLVLGDNKIGPNCGILAQVLGSSSLPNLVEVDLNRNGLGSLGTSRLFQATSCSQLRRLSLVRNNIGADQCPEFVDIILEHLGNGFPCLETLDLGDNPLGSSVTLALAECLRKSTCAPLKSLYLAHCAIGSSSCALFLVQSIPERLENIDLRMTSLSNTHVEAVAELLRSSEHNLKSVNLSANHGITMPGCDALVDALKTNQTLEILHVADCGFGLEGASKIVNVLCDNDELQEIECDHKRMLYNPICKDKTLEKMSYMGLTMDREFCAEVVGITNYCEMEAQMLVKGSSHGFKRLPKLANKNYQFVQPNLSMDDLKIGMRCQARVFGTNGSPWFNVEILNLLDGKVRVTLVDFFKQVDDDYQEYEPTLDWSDPHFTLDDPYPVVEVGHLRVVKHDIVLLKLYYFDKNKKDCPVQETPVMFPLCLLPHWSHHLGQKAYFKSCYIKHQNFEKGAFFEVSNGLTGVNLHFPNYAEVHPDQTPIVVEWPLEALKPRERLKDTALGDVLPSVVTRKSVVNVDPVLKKKVLFVFYKNQGSHTACLRLLKKQM